MTTIRVDCKDTFFMGRVIFRICGERRCPEVRYSLLLIVIQYIHTCTVVSYIYIHRIIKHALQ